MAGIKTNRFPVLRGGATGLQIDGGGGVFVQLSTPLCDIRSKEWVYAVVDSIVHHRSAPPTAKKCLLGMCGCLIKRVNWSVSSFLRTLSLQMQPHILVSTWPFPLKFGSRTAVASGDTFGDRSAHWQERQTNSSIVLRHSQSTAHSLCLYALGMLITCLSLDSSQTFAQGLLRFRLQMKPFPAIGDLLKS